MGKCSAESLLCLRFGRDIFCLQLLKFRLGQRLPVNLSVVVHGHLFQTHQHIGYHIFRELLL